MVLFLASCSGTTGFQGGYIARVFTGITSAKGISPKSIELQWTAYPGATKYYVYSAESNLKLYDTTATQKIIEPQNPSADKTYLYSVLVQDPVTGTELGDLTSFTSVSLLPTFNFKLNGTVVQNGKNSIVVNWKNGYAGVTYKVFVAKREPNGSIQYNFDRADSSQLSASSAVITGLEHGREYCAVVVAQYQDNNRDSPDGTAFTGDVATEMKKDFHLKGANGTFTGSRIATSQKCARTESDFNVSGYSVRIPQATLSSRPVFYANVSNDNTEDSAGPATITIYRMDENGGNAIEVGSRTGTGRINTTLDFASGRYRFFSVATSTAEATKGAQIPIEIIVGTENSAPNNENERKWVYVRAFSSSESTSSAYFPEKQQEGKGAQGAGSSVALGDFDCNGSADLAFGVPNAIEYGDDDLPSRMGKVVIYYDYQTSHDASRKQIIQFDISNRGFTATAARNLMLGTRLFVGNFNKDHQLNNQNPSNLTKDSSNNDLKAVFQCDDLAIASGQGPMFVLYGKRSTNVVSGTDGGLNFLGSKNFIVNTDGPCDPSVNVCSPTLFYMGPSNNRTGLGKSFTSGDYNGDGYLDLAVSTNNFGIWVFRGSDSGLVPPNPYPANSVDLQQPGDVVETILGQDGFPYIPSQQLADSNSGVVRTPTSQLLDWGTSAADGGFGVSIGTFHNAYYDAYTKGVRSVLLIGNPTARNLVNGPNTGRGRVYACKPESFNPANGNTLTATDLNNSFLRDTLQTRQFRWLCDRSMGPPIIQQAVGNTTPANVAGVSFGSQITSIENALRYKPSQFTTSGCGGNFGNCAFDSTQLGYPGAFAVSDPSGNDQKVFVYFGLDRPNVTANLTTRAELGNARNSLLNNLFNVAQNAVADPVNQRHASGAANDALQIVSNDPCSLETTVFKEKCNIQKIKPSNSNWTCGFGAGLAAFPGSVVAGDDLAKNSLLAVVCPRSTVTSSDGSTYSNVGTVRLYSQSSVDKNSPIVVNSDTNNASLNLERLSKGFSNSIYTDLTFVGDTFQNNVNFGVGGVAAGPTMALIDRSRYSSNYDVFVGAPGYTKMLTGGKAVVSNGAVFGFYSHNGSLNRYRMNESGPQASQWHVFDGSYSQEADYKFHQVVSVGDMNADDIGDIAVRINRGSQNQIRFYYGQTGDSTTPVKFNTNSNSYRDFSVSGDSSAGIRFVPAGKIGTGDFPYFFITGTNDSYLFASGLNGIIAGLPAVAGSPLRLQTLTGTDPNNPLVSYLNFSDRSFYNNETTGAPTTTLRPNASFAHGDFNGDGYEDFAMGMNISPAMYTVNANGAGTINFAANYGTGRVMIWYGGGVNGFQRRADANGGYPLNSNYFVPLSATNNADPATNRPCVVATGQDCKIQSIMEQGTANFGESILAVPFGTCTVNESARPVHALMVHTRFANPAGGAPNSAVYIYKPKCLSEQVRNNFTDLSGLYVDTTDNQFTHPNSTASTTFGYSMALVEGARGTNTRPLVAISDQSLSRIYVYPTNATNTTELGQNGTRMLMGTVSANAVNDFATTANQNLGLRLIDYSTIYPNGSQILFAQSMSAAGDLNGDGYQDLAVSAPLMNRVETTRTYSSQGGVLILYGGTNGFQSHDSTSRLYTPEKSAECYMKSKTDSVCQPSLVFLPQYQSSERQGQFEMVYLPQDAVVKDTKKKINDGLGTLLMGAPEKDTAVTNRADRILNAGGFHALP